MKARAQRSNSLARDSRYPVRRRVNEQRCNLDNKWPRLRRPFHCDYISINCSRRESQDYRRPDLAAMSQILRKHEE